MPTATVRIPEDARDTLRDLATQTGKPMREVLLDALEAYRRQVFFDQLDAAYAGLRADPEAWREVEAERAEWDATLMDGIEDA